MFTFQPLRDYLDSKGLSVTRLTQELNFTSNIAAAINNDRSIKLEQVAKICIHIDLPIEEVVEITRNTDA